MERWEVQGSGAGAEAKMATERRNRAGATNGGSGGTDQRRRGNMERRLEGEADLPTAGGSPRCGPVSDDEDEMSICDAFDEVEGPNSIRPAARGEGR